MAKIPKRILLAVVAMLATLSLCAVAAVLFIGGGRQYVAPIYNRTE